MSFENTVSADYKVAAHDASESGTFTTRASGVTTALTFVDSHELTVDQMVAAGIAIVGERAKHFSFPAAQISAVVLGDYFTDSGSTIWQVKKAVKDDLGICWECDCVQNR